MAARRRAGSGTPDNNNGAHSPLSSHAALNALPINLCSSSAAAAAADASRPQHHSSQPGALGERSHEPTAVAAPARGEMDFIISLAHFCEIHGPTSILCTHVAAVACDSCRHPCDTPLADDLFTSPASPKAFWDTSQSSPVESPPTSPRSAHNPYFPHLPADRSARRYRPSSSSADTTDTDDGCDNCTFVVPKNVTERLPEGAPGSPRHDGRGRHGSPVLRTRQYIVVPDSSPCVSTASDPSSETDSDSHSVHNSRDTIRRAPLDAATCLTASPPSDDGVGGGHGHEHDLSTVDSAVSSPLSDEPPRLLRGRRSSPHPHTHTHSLTYVSARHPASSAHYSLLRRACIRTLSQEKLPSGGRSGPLYFGDAVAGYSVAYIFRLPDPRARGRWRTYALIALGGRDGFRVARAMAQLTRKFERLATSIGSLAEAALERDSSDGGGGAVGLASSSPGSLSSPTTPTGPLLSAAHLPAPAPAHAAATNPRITPVSSFLSAKKVDPDGYPRIGREVMKPKGLAEIVGRDDFFVGLHSEFALILNMLAARL